MCLKIRCEEYFRNFFWTKQSLLIRKYVFNFIKKVTRIQWAQSPCGGAAGCEPRLTGGTRGQRRQAGDQHEEKEWAPPTFSSALGEDKSNAYTPSAPK